MDIMKEDEQGHQHYISVHGRGREHKLYDQKFYMMKPRTQLLMKHLDKII